jgi:hypothetical protein
MIFEVLRAVFIGGVPVVIFTFLVTQWAFATGRIVRKPGRGERDSQGDRDGDRARQRDPSNRARQMGDLVHSKLMFFGGGYYGTMAALTYMMIECLEIWRFLPRLSNPDMEKAPVVAEPVPMRGFCREAARSRFRMLPGTALARLAE